MKSESTRTEGAAGHDFEETRKPEPRLWQVADAIPAFARSIDDDASVRATVEDKPCARADLLTAVDGGVSRRALVPAAPPAARIAGIVGASEALQFVIEQIGLVADTDATVLITGET